jgi:hypothetical protein
MHRRRQEPRHVSGAARCLHCRSMKAVVLCTLALAALALAVVSLAAAPNTAVSSAVHGAHNPSSSFAPQGRPGPKVYGLPIQKTILHRRKPAKRTTPAP